MEDESLIESICRNYGFSREVVLAQRQIPDDDAISRYLSPESRVKLADLRGGPDPNVFSRQQRLANALNYPGHMAKFKNEFYQTPEGKLWYDCNVHPEVTKEIAARAYSDTLAYARDLQEGQARTQRRLRREHATFKG